MKVLLIDDDPEIADLIYSLFALNWPEAKLTSADNGAQGVHMVKGDNPDVVILDLGLPDVDGFEVLSEIRKVSYVPVLVLTVRSEAQYTVKALDLGADDYVMKPFSHLVLLARVRAVFKRGQIGAIARRALLSGGKLDEVPAGPWSPGVQPV